MSVGIQWRLSGTRSLPVMTAATPGILSALDVSMLLMRACAYGLRAMSRYSIPGSFTSSTYLPLPRMKRASSLRLTLCPMPPISTDIWGLPFRSHRLRRVLDRLHDVHVAGAAAEIPRDRRSEEHTSELQSRLHLVCRLLLEKKKKQQKGTRRTARAGEQREYPTHIR